VIGYFGRKKPCKGGIPRVPVEAQRAQGRQKGALRKLMLVDDEPDIAEVLTLGLRRKGFDVEAFVDPVVALANFKANYYDLVISDVRMPKMNGLELAFEIKKKDSDQRIVFLTAYLDLFTELKKLFQRMDVLDVIQKPIGIAELTDRLVELDAKRNQTPPIS
jgi:DNA-binding response OmpR family regulator